MARILVADDSETILLLLRTRLEMEGHEVETAADGQEVVDKVSAANPPDILLLDAMMPAQVRHRRPARAPRRRHRDPGPDSQRPHRRRQRRRDHADLAIDGYIAKPIDFDQLFAKIAELTRPGPAT